MCVGCRMATTADITPAPFNVRTRVHEYGGGSYLVHQGTVYFSNFADQRLYRQDADAEPVAITPEAALRYADGVVDIQRQRLICVREDHTGEGEAVNTIASISLDGNTEQQVLVSGSDFYSSPRLSPDGSQLAWLCWNHPNMPWDGTELWVATVTAAGTVADAQKIAGGISESVLEPRWSPDGVLYFVSDRSGWWNLYRWQGEIEPLCPMDCRIWVAALGVWYLRTMGLSRRNVCFAPIAKKVCLISPVSILRPNTWKRLKRPIPKSAAFTSHRDACCLMRVRQQNQGRSFS